MIARGILVLSLALSVSSAAAAQQDCAGAIDQLRTVVDSDAATGNLNRTVYAQMQPGLSQATALCRAGRSAEALRELAAVKHRFGYR